MASQNKRKAGEGDTRSPPEVVEFCRIIAGVFRRTSQSSLVNVERADGKQEEQPEVNK